MPLPDPRHVASSQDSAHLSSPFHLGITRMTPRTGDSPGRDPHSVHIAPNTPIAQPNWTSAHLESLPANVPQSSAAQRSVASWAEAVASASESKRFGSSVSTNSTTKALSQAPTSAAQKTLRIQTTWMLPHTRAPLRQDLSSDIACSEISDSALSECGVSESLESISKDYREPSLPHTSQAAQSTWQPPHLRMQPKPTASVAGKLPTSSSAVHDVSRSPFSNLNQLSENKKNKAADSTWTPPHLRGFVSESSACHSEAISAVSHVERPREGKTDLPSYPRSPTSAVSANGLEQQKALPPHLRGVPLVAASSKPQAQLLHRSLRSSIEKQPLGAGLADLRLDTQPSSVAPAPKIRTGDAATWAKDQKPSRSVKLYTKFPCPHDSCGLGFSDLKALRNHRKNQHEYCSICDLDFIDFKEHIDHKMRSDRHITCPVCGEDFRSEGGRDRHIYVMHPEDQDLPCQGCGEKFTRAGGLIDHIEKSRCEGITIGQFERYRAMQAIQEAQLSTLAKMEADMTASVDEDNDFSDGGLLGDYVAETNTESGYAEEFPKLGSSASIASAQQKPKITGKPKLTVPAWLAPDRADVIGNKENPRKFVDSLADVIFAGEYTAPKLFHADGQPLEAINPDSVRYNPSEFLSVLGKYRCPYPGCG